MTTRNGEEKNELSLTNLFTSVTICMSVGIRVMARLWKRIHSICVCVCLHDRSLTPVIFELVIHVQCDSFGIVLREFCYLYRRYTQHMCMTFSQ